MNRARGGDYRTGRETDTSSRNRRLNQTMPTDKLPTSISTSDERSITVRGKDLTEELMGECGFGEFFYFHLTGELPTDAGRRVFEAMLVSISEHGITASVIAARLTYNAAPEALQGAISSGILGTGSQFLGSMENVAEILEGGQQEVEEGASPAAVAESIVDEHDRLPGFGHPLHKPTDPRADRLLELYEEEGFSGPYVELLTAIRDVAQAEYDANLAINVTGAIGAGVLELGFDPMVARGVAIVARAAGLVGHINEEIEQPIGLDMWDAVEENVEYRGP